MNFEDLITATMVIIAVLILVAAALLIWCAIMALRVESALRQINRILDPLRNRRDHLGRPYKERL